MAQLLFSTILANNYQTIRSLSVVYKLNKGIFSLVQINVYFSVF